MEADKPSGTPRIEASPSNAVTAAEKRLLRKVDFHVLPLLILLLGLSSIDRINISSARVSGLEEDLGLVGNQFNVALLGKCFLCPACDVSKRC